MITFDYRIFGRALLRSYSQVFFSQSIPFALLLMVVSLGDFSSGIAGLIAVTTATAAACFLGFDRATTEKGLYGFNSLLVGLGLGYFFQLSVTVVLIAVFAGFFTFLITIALQGVLGKYYLPYLSIPFVLGIWIVIAAGWQLTSADVNDSGLYILNKLFDIGGIGLVRIHDWWKANIDSEYLNSYFVSLGAILFQFNVVAGLLIAVALLLYSRIAFTLSVVGYSVAFFAFKTLGLDLTQLGYSYIGFNFILGAIAIGGYYYIPTIQSYLWAVLITPVIALLAAGLHGILGALSLPLLSLPFNVVLMLFIYSMRFRYSKRNRLREVAVQEGSPERNLYSFHSFSSRFPYFGWFRIRLPFHGEWVVNQGHNGKHTHKDEWAYAWDFVIVDSNGLQYRNSGDVVSDYFCYNQRVLAPADGVVVTVDNSVEDNPIGKVNIVKNWGNSVVIKHADGLYSKLSHLQKGSVTVKEGDRVRSGQPVGKVGNSGRSAYPHLHFQLQVTEYIGSKTLKYPIASFLENGNAIRSFSYPLENSRVRNTESEPFLRSVFNLTPGITLKWSINAATKSDTVVWEVLTTSANIPYIYCRNTGAIAYFRNDGTYFTFTHFVGNRNSLLYRFYLAVYRVPLVYLEGTETTDYIPVNKLFGYRKLFLHDFIAPFFRFLRAEYVVRVKRLGGEFDCDGYVIRSVVTGTRFGRVQQVRSFTLTLSSEKSLRLVDNQNETEALCKIL